MVGVLLIAVTWTKEIFSDQLGVYSTLWPEGKEQDVWAPGLAGLFALPQKSDPTMEVAPDGTIIGRHKGFGPTH